MAHHHMTPMQIERHHQKLLDLRDRLDETIERISETVRTDAVPVGEHDHHVGESSEKELVLEQDEELIRRQVQHALERIEAGNFGQCEKCGSPIGRERLEAIPYAAYCVACERIVESGASPSST